jgi:hypothetical protein
METERVFRRRHDHPELTKIAMLHCFSYAKVKVRIEAHKDKSTIPNKDKSGFTKFDLI